MTTHWMMLYSTTAFGELTRCAACFPPRNCHRDNSLQLAYTKHRQTSKFATTCKRVCYFCFTSNLDLPHPCQPSMRLSTPVSQEGNPNICPHVFSLSTRTVQCGQQVVLNRTSTNSIQAFDGEYPASGPYGEREPRRYMSMVSTHPTSADRSFYCTGCTESATHFRNKS
ncbi:hypothetical protein F5X99DRAFT_367905 [Biscogniauxia marginata]|nr:hypothetical protein F5X99DRAFT_367905 [Biscogniauxia marginata]